MGAGEVIIRAKHPVAVTAHQTVFTGIPHRVIIPCVPGHIGERVHPYRRRIITHKVQGQVAGSEDGRLAPHIVHGGAGGDIAGAVQIVHHHAGGVLSRRQGVRQGHGGIAAPEVGDGPAAAPQCQIEYRGVAHGLFLPAVEVGGLGRGDGQGDLTACLGLDRGEGIGVKGDFSLRELDCQAPDFLVLCLCRDVLDGGGRQLHRVDGLAQAGKVDLYHAGLPVVPDHILNLRGVDLAHGGGSAGHTGADADGAFVPGYRNGDGGAAGVGGHITSAACGGLGRHGQGAVHIGDGRVVVASVGDSRSAGGDGIAAHGVHVGGAGQGGRGSQRLAIGQPGHGIGQLRLCAPHHSGFIHRRNGDGGLFDGEVHRGAADVFFAVHRDCQRVVSCIDGACVPAAAPGIGNCRVRDGLAVQCLDDRGAGVVDGFAVIGPPGHAHAADLHGDFIGDGHGGRLGSGGVLAIHGGGAGGNGDNRIYCCPLRDGKFAVCDRLFSPAPNLVGQRNGGKIVQGSVMGICRGVLDLHDTVGNLIGGDGQGDLRCGGGHGHAGVNIPRRVVVCGISGDKGHGEIPVCCGPGVPAGPAPASGNGGAVIGVRRCAARQGAVGQLLTVLDGPRRGSGQGGRGLGNGHSHIDCRGVIVRVGGHERHFILRCPGVGFGVGGRPVPCSRNRGVPGYSPAARQGAVAQRLSVGDPGGGGGRRDGAAGLGDGTGGRSCVRS